MSSNKTAERIPEFQPELKKRLEQLALAKYSPASFLVGEAINNFIQINRQHSENDQVVSSENADFFLGAFI